MFFKLLRKDWLHFNFQYVVGINTDINLISSSDKVGLHFCELNDLFHWLGLYDDLTTVCKVELLNDSQIYSLDKALKTDKFILSDPMSIGEFLQKYNIELTAVQQCPYALYYIKEQTEDMCLAAVQQTGCALPYVKTQTEEICLTAVRKTAGVLQYVKIQTDAICLAAVQHNPLELKYVHTQTPVICITAVQQDGQTLVYVKKQTPDICAAAIKQNVQMVEFVKSD